MSGEVDVTPGYIFDDETVTLAKLNLMLSAMVLRIQAGAVGTRELADGTITADKLDSEVAAQLGIPDGSITLAKLIDGILADSAAGRLKMADSYITLAKLKDGIFTGDAAGQAKFASDFLSADAGGRALMEDGFITAAKLATGDAVQKAADALAFRAYKNAAQTITKQVPVKVQLDAESFDDGGTFAGYKHTPTVAGRYQYNAATALYMAYGQDTRIMLYKNGAVHSIGHGYNGGNTHTVYATVSDIISMNGTTDYIELYMLQESSSDLGITTGATNTWMSGALIGAA